MNIKDELLKELSTIDYKNGMNIDTIKLNTDLGVKIIENVVKKLIIPDVVNQRELLLKKQSDWLMLHTKLEVENIVSFTEEFKQ
jgi:hypothetical protein